MVSFWKSQEFQVAEAIHCPSCSTRYRLRPERLRPRYRRAQCFTCGSIFPVGDLVQKLLALPDPSATSGLRIEDLAAAQNAPVTPPSLTLGDLDLSEGELLEKTLVDAPLNLPEIKPEPQAPPVAPLALPPEITETTLSGYTSARDAIDKLFGDVPAASPSLHIEPTQANPTDLEATLSALDSTLGGTEPTPASRDDSDHPTMGGFAQDPETPSTATVRLSQSEMQAVLAAVPPVPARPGATAMAASPALPHEERTEVLAPGVEPAAAKPQAEFLSAPSTEAGAELLRLRIGEEIYGGLTMPQLIAWVEEGRILENHMVARQHSENWLEAHKVPGLRPVFERLRREHSGGAPSLEPGFGESGAHKKGLFGGLFGKG